MELTFVIMVIPSSLFCERTVSLRHILSSDLREMCLCLLVDYTNGCSPDNAVSLFILEIASYLPLTPF